VFLLLEPSLLEADYRKREERAEREGDRWCGGLRSGWQRRAVSFLVGWSGGFSRFARADVAEEAVIGRPG
jgi:hypothetical protein